MKKALVFIVLLVALITLLVAPAALAVVDDITPADNCSGKAVGSQAIPALDATRAIMGFPVPNNNPGNAPVSSAPTVLPPCNALTG